MPQPSTVSILKAQHKNYNGIDLFKFICAFFVVLIHIPPLNAHFGEALSTTEKYINFGIQKYLSRLAVPFYFTSTGFFLFHKMSTACLDTERIKNHCFKLLKLTGAWSVLLFVGSTQHLWYLGASVVAITFLSLCLHWNVKPSILLCITLFLYLVGMLFDSYFGFIKPLLENTLPRYLYTAWNLIVGNSRNGLFMGSIFVLMGIFFSQGKIRIKFAVALIGFFLSMVCLFVEVYFLGKYKIPADYNMYLFLLPSVFFLFAIASTITLKDSPIYKRLRMIGMLIYFLHMIVRFFVAYCISFLYKFLSFDLRPWLFLLTLVPTVIVAVCFERLAQKKRFTWINWFLS